jgi:arginase
VSVLTLLGVPMDLGAGRRGVDMGPSALRLARLGDTLRALGHDVRDLGNVEVPVAESVVEDGSDARYVTAIAAVCGAVAAVLADLPDHEVPLVLGGDHAISLGSVAGVRRRRGGRVGVIWVDAHADLNTPATSPSGNVHGMPLAHLLGHGDRRLIAAVGADGASGADGDPGAAGVSGADVRASAPEPIVRPEDVVMIGLRSVDPGERAFIRRHGLAAFTMSDIDRSGIAAVTAAALAALGHVDRLHVSFDADVLDPAVAPGVGTPIPGGLAYREAHLLMELLHESGRVGSLDLVEVNPILDHRNQTAFVLAELAASLFGRTIL